MKPPTKNTTTTTGVLALGLILATLLATLVPSAPSGADVVPAGNARSWGDNFFGQLGNGSSGAGTGSDVPVAVKDLLDVKNLDGGYEFSLAALQ